MLGAIGLLHTRNDERKDQGRLRPHADDSRRVHVRLLEATTPTRSVDPYIDGGGAADLRRPVGLRQRLLRPAAAAPRAEPLDSQRHRGRLGLRDRRHAVLASTTTSSARPTTASATGTSFGRAGRVAVLDGTGWYTLDAKATWRPAWHRRTRSASARTTTTTRSPTPPTTRPIGRPAARTPACSPRATARPRHAPCGRRTAGG